VSPVSHANGSLVTEFRYHPQADWPELAWLASTAIGLPIDIFHGTRVETRPDWFAEAVWDGDFAAGDFDSTDLFFGSGARRRNGAIVFVPSATTVDRLQWIEAKGRLWVSNSLVALLAATGAELDPTDPSYFAFFGTITQGLRRYRRELASSIGPVHLAYYHNLRWENGRLTEQEKPHADRPFADFAEYRSFLSGTDSPHFVRGPSGSLRSMYRGFLRRAGLDKCRGAECSLVVERRNWLIFIRNEDRSQLDG